MKLLFLLLALALVYPAEARVHRGYKRPLLYVPWKTVAAGGVAAGTVIAAYKVSNGVEEGLKTVAEKKPEVFSDAVSSVTSPIRWTLWLALLGIGYWLYKKITSKMKGKNHGESIEK